MRHSITIVVVLTLLTACSGSGGNSSATVISGTGDEVATKIDDFRQLFGTNNGGGPGPFTGGYREINWDTVPDEISAPADYAPDLFNATKEPLARGVILTTSGTLRVSADSDNPTNALPRFGEINPIYPDVFQTFSAERLFSTVGSNLVEINFYVPGSNTPGLTRGFGAIAVDVDTSATTYEYFDAQGNSLGVFHPTAAPGGLSFLGVIFDQPIVTRVRVTLGSAMLGPDDDAQKDIVVLDNWVYGEPQPAP
jgi:hypothetical protein